MVEKFKTLFFVKSSLISLYLALTFPIPFISSEKFKIFSIITFVFGLFLIIDITNDYVNTCEKKISYETSYISKILGKKAGKDKEKNKATFVSNLGLDNSKKKATDLVAEACEAISVFKDRSRNLCQIANFIVSRQF